MRKIIIFLFFILHNTNNFCQSNNLGESKIDLSRYYKEGEKIYELLRQMPSSFESNLYFTECHACIEQQIRSLKNINKYYHECIKDFIMELKSNLKKHFSNVNLGECKELGEEEGFDIIDYLISQINPSEDDLKLYFDGKKKRVDKKDLGEAGLCWEENKNYIEKKLEEISKISPAIFFQKFYHDQKYFTDFYQVTKDGEEMLDCKKEHRLAPECLYEYGPLYPNCEEELNKNELGLFEIFVTLSNAFFIRLPVCNKFGHIGSIVIYLYTEPFLDSYCKH